MVAQWSLVPPGSPSPVRPASVVTQARWFPDQNRQGRSLRSPHTPPGCLETLQRSLCRGGVLAQVAVTICATHRSSTRHLYHATWQSFCCWCHGRGKDPPHPSVRTVLAYLQHLKGRGVKHNTILTHISALSNCTDWIKGVPVGKHLLVAHWVISNRSLKTPTHTLVPKWDISVVLVALTEHPYEPLRHATLKDLTLKTIFLIAAASTRRVSELHALCKVPPFLIQRPGSFTLTTNPAFLPKTATEQWRRCSLDIELSAFHPNPKNDLERGLRLLCPVRA